jgi:hypothetical protein
LIENLFTIGTLIAAMRALAETDMKLKDLAHGIEARLHPGSGNGESEIARIYAGDTMSGLIAHAAADTMIVTSLNNAQLARIAELMDLPGICLVNGASPVPELVETARTTGTGIMVSPADLEATHRALQKVLGA